MPEYLTVDHLLTAAAEFAPQFSALDIPVLYGVDNGKTIGTHLEVAFNDYVIERFDYTPGNAASGIDFPELAVDLKVTSITQPQSSCPFRDATQKVYGLGYHLIVMVYAKHDDHQSQTAKLDIQHVVFIHAEATADFQLTSGIHKILDNGGNIGFSSPFCGQFDGDAAAAEVDHSDERGGGVVAVAAVVDEPDLAVESFEL